MAVSPKGRKSAAMRAWYSMPTESRRAINQNVRKQTGSAMTKAQKAAQGRVVRKTRLSRGTNPNTGAAFTAKQLGLKGTAKKAYRAYSTAAKTGMVKAVAGNKSGVRGVRRAVRRHYRKSM